MFLKNLFIALASPIKAINYGIAYFAHKRMISIFTGRNLSEVAGLYKEILNSDFMREISLRSSSSAAFSNLSMLVPFRAPTLYVLCRIFKPKIVVETGVANGYSSAFILQALQKNGSGKLYSIDLPNQSGQELGKNRSIGWVIPESLKDRWSLIIGSTQDKLEPLLKGLKNIDIFYHDSDHSYQNMMYEFKKADEYLLPGGIIVSDDITDNDAFDDFSQLKSSSRCVKLFKLGVLKNDLDNTRRTTFTSK